MKILKVKFSRNGSGSCHPFITVLFEDRQLPREYDANVCGEQFIATFTQTDDSLLNFDADSIRVQNIKNFDLNWRGDYFARKFPYAIDKYCKDLNLREISISAACFPEQYQKEETETIS